jgi:hypothetical protein
MKTANHRRTSASNNQAHADIEDCLEHMAIAFRAGTGGLHSAEN